ncbi:MAG: DegV family protein [Collinsella sp.]
MRGGRISAASAIIGTALKICPLMTVDCEGKLSPREKIRTKKRAISEMAKTMMVHVQDGADYSGKCIMSHSACREDAEAVAALIEEQVPQLKGKIEINNIGV